MVRLVLIGLMLMPGAAVASEASTLDDSARAAIVQLVDDYQAARTEGDRAALETLLRADMDQLTSSGQWRRGRDAALAGMQRSSSQNPGERRLHVEQVRALGVEAAIADARYVIVRADGQRRVMWSSFVVVRDADQWRIAGIRNMRPSPLGAPAAEKDSP
ncbi:alpha/beta hydrolase [Salinisphaera dokdonensis CL-ES53]|uniref:Alpha/beta hydrolase n=1 Tax=Salinisphaera dokdonensis CL-ES53 TaxID=1304272 RepID=A0ABV2AZY5_9GAMM